MENHDRQNQAAGFSLAAVYDNLLRHKWKIIGLTSAGLLAAALACFFQQPAAYSSEAKLLIRYVMESRLPDGVYGDSQIKAPDPGGANIINTEIEIMKSMDLAVQVAEAIGPEKILGKSAGETNKYLAATILKTGLSVEVPPQSDILRLVFQHPNRELVQPVLSQFIDAYLRKHVEVHRSVGAFDDVLTQQTDALRSQLALTEQRLRAAKTNAGVMSIEDSKKAYTEALSKIRQELFNTQAELAGRQAALAKRQELLPVRSETPNEKPAPDVPSQPGPRLGDRSDEASQIAALQARLVVLNTQLEELTAHARTVNELEPAITELQKQKELEETKYRAFSARLEQARFEDALGAGRMSNISVVQAPTPPRGESKPLLKTLAMIVGAGFFGGIALAGLCELGNPNRRKSL
jgi:succinoglycan biosynthesis transport protein ExoP